MKYQCITFSATVIPSLSDYAYCFDPLLRWLQRVFLIRPRRCGNAIHCAVLKYHPLHATTTGDTQKRFNKYIVLALSLCVAFMPKTPVQNNNAAGRKAMPTDDT